MPFAASLSQHPETTAAVEEAVGMLGDAAASPDLVVAFFSPHHAADADLLGKTLREKLSPRVLLGVVGESIVGNDREIEHGPALSVWLGKWPESSRLRLDPFHLFVERTSEGHSLLGRPDSLDGADARSSAVLLFGDPFTFPTDYFLEQINEDHQGLRVVGGMAGGVSGRGECRLLLDGEVKTFGAVGVLMQGEFGLRSVVSQGCRPIGTHLTVTKAEENIVFELEGRPPLTVLQELWPTLSERDQQLFSQGLHVGFVINEFLSEYRRGDFLIRNVQGLDRRTGAMAVGDRVRAGQVIQFHVRDSAAADEDLHELIRRDVTSRPRRPAGALLFTCNGRGTRMFDVGDHDARALRAEAGPVPLAGFFAAGEIGPIGGQNFIHGFTASVALFDEADPR